MPANGHLAISTTVPLPPRPSKSPVVLKVKKDVPLPPSKSISKPLPKPPGPAAVLKSMKVGESVYAADKDIGGKDAQNWLAGLGATIRKVAGFSGYKLTTRREKNGARLWRIK